MTCNFLIPEKFKPIIIIIMIIIGGIKELKVNIKRIFDHNNDKELELMV